MPSRSASKSELYAVLARRFLRGRIHACLWRDPHEFPRLIGFDMDVIVRPRSWSAVPRLIQEALHDCGWHLLAWVRRGTVHTLLVRRNNASSLSDDDFLQIDLHRFLTARAVPYVDLPALFERAVMIEGAPFLSPVDGATISMLEPTFTGNSPNSRTAAAFEEAKRAEPTRVAQLLCQAVGNAGLEPGLSSSRIWRRALFQAVLRRPVAFATILWLIAAERLAAFLRPAGLMISISGPDGVGKSTLIESLSNRAKRRVCLGIDVYHTRPFLIPPASRLLARIQRDGARIVRNRERYTSPLTSWVRLAITIVDYWLGYWVKVRPRLAKGNLVVFDRYFLDYRVEPRIRGIDLSQTILRHANRSIPRPHLQIVLVAAPETIIARKQELDMPGASEQLHLYRQLASESSDSLVLDTDQSGSEELALQILCRLAAFQGQAMVRCRGTNKQAKFPAQ